MDSNFVPCGSALTNTQEIIIPLYSFVNRKRGTNEVRDTLSRRTSTRQRLCLTLKIVFVK